MAASSPGTLDTGQVTEPGDREEVRGTVNQGTIPRVIDRDPTPQVLDSPSWARCDYFESYFQVFRPVGILIGKTL